MRGSNLWNRYQTYFAIFQNEERARVNDPGADCEQLLNISLHFLTFVFIAAKCYTSFIKLHREKASAVIEDELALDRLNTNQESVQKRGRIF